MGSFWYGFEKRAVSADMIGRFAASGLAKRRGISISSAAKELTKKVESANAHNMENRLAAGMRHKDIDYASTSHWRRDVPNKESVKSLVSDANRETKSLKGTRTMPPHIEEENKAMHEAWRPGSTAQPEAPKKAPLTWKHYAGGGIALGTAGIGIHHTMNNNQQG